MKVWVEIAKDKSRPCYVFQYKPINRSIDFGYENGPSDGVAVYYPNQSIIDSNLVQYLRDFTLERGAIGVSRDSFLYEVEL